MKTIEQLIDELIEREGGYVRDLRDAGGETKYGITEAVARAHGYGGAMVELPRETAAAIYRRIYWTKPGFDQVAAIPEAGFLAAELFDTGVNMGPTVAITFLQRALNALNRDSLDYPDLIADGRIGPATLMSLKGFIKVRGVAGQTVLLKALNALQGARYIELAEGRKANEAFLYGWLLNRVSL